ncbi:MAG: DJ-1/PfpI family protein [Clostridia bacterium]|nr:DJ-1/PfpI family protein [Clostridia bacterium]
MVYCFLAPGFEELEAIAPIDLLRRAGLTVTTVGVGEKTVCGSHGIPVTADVTADAIVLDDSLEAVILPGGMPGTLNLEQSPAVQKAIDFAAANGKLLCAICAAPSVLGHKGLLNGKQATAYPGFEADLTGAALSDRFVVTDGNRITARGAGVAVEFGLAIITALKGAAAAERIRKSIQCLP